MVRKLHRLAQLGLSYSLKRLEPLGPPYQFAIEATNFCNFKCSFCPQSNPDHRRARPYGHLAVENYAAFLRNVKALRPGNPNLSICLDGEPLMHREFPELVRLANREGFHPRFSSNGRLFTRDIAEQLSSCSWLAAIDFSGEEQVFDEVRGRAGDFAIVLENLRFLVGMAATRPGITLEIVDVTHFVEGHDGTASLAAMRALFPPSLPRNIRFWSRKFHNFGGHLDLGGAGKNYKLCPYPWTAFNVTWDGNVVACCRDTEARSVLGNAFSEPILDIWRGERYRRLRRSLVDRRPDEVAACRPCDMPYSAGDSRWSPRYILSSLLRR